MKDKILFLLALGGACWLAWVLRPYPVTAQPKNPSPSPVIWERKGPTLRVASWYARGLHDPEKLTCASREHPRGTYLEARVGPKDEWVRMRVNDYGPEEWTNRQLDVSLGAARKLGMVRKGLAILEIREVKEN